MSFARVAAWTALATTTMLVACGGRSVSPANDDAARVPDESDGGTGAEPSNGGNTSSGGAGAEADGSAQGGSTGVAGSGAPGGAGGTDRYACQSIGIRCTEGTICGDLRCGIADSGRRSCRCMANDWTCTPCDFSNGDFLEPPAVIEECPPDVVDELPCTNDLTVCGPTDIGEYCACWQSPSDGQSWDCDDAPPHWGL